MTSSCPWLNSQILTETFTYDASDQLVSASETQAQSYQLAVTYGNWGKISGYSLAQTDLQQNVTTSEAQSYTYPASNNLQSSQSLFAPASRSIQKNGQPHSMQTFTFGINGSLRKVETHVHYYNMEYFLFNSAANLKAYSNNGLDFAYYGYNASNTRTYKLSMLNQNQWVNGQPQPLNLQLQNAMFYPNAYINFNQNGEYTKHYYNGSERICSRLGNATLSIATTVNNRLNTRSTQADNRFQADVQDLVDENIPQNPAGQSAGFTPIPVTSLQPANATSDIFYYHMNHLGSTAYVTDNNATITQGFLYAPFGEITTEYNANFSNNVLPKYSFNAKELDEETGMYYYEARYYKPPVFTSRDPMFEKYFWMTPYAYCANNPVKYVDPDGEDWVLSTGNKVYWYAGNKGDKSTLLYTYNASSGYQNDDTKEDYRQAQYQNLRDKGPTPEGEYFINLVPDPERKAKIGNNGALLRSNVGGIEQLVFTNDDGSEFFYPDWGYQRALLQPYPGKVTGAKSTERDIYSFYMHDSQKCYTHGCTEIESEFFDQLKAYRDAGNKRIDVVIEYPNEQHKTVSDECYQ